MVLISSRNELKSYVVNGEVCEPVSIQPGSILMKVDYLTSLKNIHCDGKFAMSGLTGIKSLTNLTFGSGVILSGVSNAVEIDRLKLGRNCKIQGLLSLERIGSFFCPGAGGSLTELDNLDFISPFIMWPKGFVLSGVKSDVLSALPDMLKSRLKIN